MKNALPVIEFHMPQKGERVVLHCACDEWMQGDKYGTVKGYSQLRECYERGNDQHYRTRLVYVTLDSGRVRRFHPANITAI